MYNKTFTTKNGRERKEMKYYTVNKVTAEKLGALGKGILVQARDRASAANKIRREYKIALSGRNLREVKTYREMIRLDWGEKMDREMPAKYSRVVATI